MKDQDVRGGGGKWGAGYLHVYQSTNGGATFTNIGLPLTIAQKQDAGRQPHDGQPADRRLAVHRRARHRRRASSTATSARIYVATSIGVFEGLGTKSSSGAAMQWQWYDSPGPSPGSGCSRFASTPSTAKPSSPPSVAILRARPEVCTSRPPPARAGTQMGKGQFADVLTLSLSRSQRGHYLVNAAPVGSASVTCISTRTRGSPGNGRSSRPRPGFTRR